MKARRLKKTEQPPTTVPPNPSEGLHRWWWHAVVILGLLLANLWLYHGTLDLGFLSVDDGDYVQNNPHIDSFRAANLKHIFTVSCSANYAPAHLLSYSLDVALAGGKSAFALHLSNVMWHGWVVCMVYLLAFTLRSEIASATAAALLFLLHPAHVEVVAWISSRKDLVATGFAALSMTCYLLCRRRHRSRGWWYAASLLCFLLASAGKQSVLLLPLVMLTWDFLVEKRRNWQMLADKVPFGLITIFFGWMTWHAQPGTNQPLHAFVFAGTQFANLWLLTGLGDYVMYRGAPDAAAWSQTARLMIIVAAALVWVWPLLLQKARQPVRAALCYWVLIQMVPPMLLSFIVPITDRYLFLPSVGVCVLLADVAAGLARRRPNARWICWCLLAGLGTVWGAKTRNYVTEWRDPRSVWYGAHLKTKDPQVAQFLGEVCQNAGDRMDNFIKSGAPLTVADELKLARAVLGDATQCRAVAGRVARRRTGSHQLHRLPGSVVESGVGTIRSRAGAPRQVERAQSVHEPGSVASQPGKIRQSHSRVSDRDEVRRGKQLRNRPAGNRNPRPLRHRRRALEHAQLQGGRAMAVESPGPPKEIRSAVDSGLGQAGRAHQSFGGGATVNRLTSRQVRAPARWEWQCPENIPKGLRHSARRCRDEVGATLGNGTKRDQP